MGLATRGGVGAFSRVKVVCQEPWKSNDDLRAVELVDALHEMEIHGLSQARLDDLALVGHRLKPWSDAAQSKTTTLLHHKYLELQ
jgi:hypothetical protein